MQTPGRAVVGGVTDLHVHVQPWRQLKPAAMETMRRGHEDHWEFLVALMDDPKLLLETMDRAGVWRVGLINYPSPDLMGFTDETNAFAARYAAAAPDRLIPFGGVHPRIAGDVEGQRGRAGRAGHPVRQDPPAAPALPGQRVHPGAARPSAPCTGAARPGACR